MERISPAIYTLLLTGAAGLWFVVAPLVLETQTVGGTWSAATRNDVVVGALLLVVSVAGLWGYLALHTRDLVAASVQRSKEADAG